MLEEETVIREHTRKKKATHEDLFKGLKVEKVVIPLPEEDQICPVCGTQMVLIGEEYVRRELEFIPATCKVIEYYSQSYGCPSCKEGLGWIFLCGSTAVPEERIPPVQRQEVLPHILV